MLLLVFDFLREQLHFSVDTFSQPAFCRDGDVTHQFARCFSSPLFYNILLGRRVSDARSLQLPQALLRCLLPTRECGVLCVTRVVAAEAHRAQRRCWTSPSSCPKVALGTPPQKIVGGARKTPMPPLARRWCLLSEQAPSVAPNNQRPPSSQW